MTVFALLNQNGDAVYSRDGQFYTNSEGILVNSMGHEFSDVGGNNIQVVPDGGTLTIDKEGQSPQMTKLSAKSVFFHLRILSMICRR